MGKWVMNAYCKTAPVIITVLLILTGMAFGLGEYLEKIEIEPVDAWFRTIKNFFPDTWETGISSYKYCLLLFSVVGVFLFLFCRFYKPRIVIVKHVSFSPELADLDHNLRKEFYVKEYSLDLSEEMKTQNISKALDLQDSEIERIKRINKKKELGYYGIAHTPFVFRAGYYVGNQKNVHLFHKARNNKSDFREWENALGNWNSSLCDSKEQNKSCASNELFVAIGTSFFIKDSEIKSIAGKNKHILILQTVDIGFDVIGSYDQAEALRKNILDRIRDLEKKYDIRKLHLLIASSVAFTFFLGTAFSAQHDPSIVVYHYRNGEYVWGIDMSKKGDAAIVRNN